MEPLIHIVVPFTALMLVGVEARKALPISLLALLPDLDVFFFVHRSFSHSAVVVVGVAAPLLLLTYRFWPRLHVYALWASLAVGSHLLLDLFCGYTPILWPLHGYAYWIHAELAGYVGGSVGLTPRVELLSEPITFQPFHSLDAPLITGEGLILSLVLLSPVLLRSFRALWQRIGRLTLE